MGFSPSDKEWRGGGGGGSKTSGEASIVDSRKDGGIRRRRRVDVHSAACTSPNWTGKRRLIAWSSRLSGISPQDKRRKVQNRPPWTAEDKNTQRRPSSKRSSEETSREEVGRRQARVTPIYQSERERETDRQCVKEAQRHIETATYVSRLLKQPYQIFIQLNKDPSRRRRPARRSCLGEKRKHFLRSESPDWSLQ